jgi:hypothetical protein
MEALSKGAILKEMVEHYSADTTKRCVMIGSGCVYNGYNGLESIHCAIGRCFRPEYKAQGTSLVGNYETGIEDLISKQGHKSIDLLLEPQYHGHDIEFWKALQSLHDLDHNWSKDGLSEIGKEVVKEIEERFGIVETLLYICTTIKE